MMKLILICGFFSIIVNSDAQSFFNETPSELISSLKKNNPDSNRLVILLLLSRDYYLTGSDDSRLDSALLFAKQAEQLSDRINSDEWRPVIFCYLGKCHLKKGETTLANSYFNKVAANIEDSGPIDTQIGKWKDLAWSIKVMDTVGLTRIDCFAKIESLYHRENNREKEVDEQKEIADTHMKQGKLDLAESELLEVLAGYKAIGFHKLYQIYNLLSVDNRLKGNYDTAVYYALQVLKIMPKDIDTAEALNYYSQVADLYHELGQTDKSIEYFRMFFKMHPVPIDFYYIREAGVFVRDLIKENKQQEARTFLSEFSKKYPPADQYGKASLARTFAYYYNAVHDYSRAEEYTRKMIALEKTLGKDNEIRRDVAYDIGRYYFDKKQFSEAKTYLKIALNEALLNNSANTLRDIHLMLFKTDSSEGNYVPAIRHLNLYRELNDSIFNVAKTRELDEVEVKYETQKKEQDIKLLQKESRLQQSQLKLDNQERNWILGGAGLLTIILVLLVRNIRLKQRTNKKLKIQQREIGDQNISLRHLVNEKEWLVREIHHRVKNNLQTVMGLLGTQTGYLKNDVAVKAITDSQRRIQAMSLIHQRLYQSNTLSSIRMTDYVHELVDSLRDSFDADNRVRFNLDIDDAELDLAHCIPLGLIMNEAITNSFKYAFPGDRQGVISISLKNTSAKNFSLTIKDNGKGLPAEFNINRSNSMGMNLMRGLSAEIGAQFTLANENGTRIHVSFIYDPDTTIEITQMKTEAINPI